VNLIIATGQNNLAMNRTVAQIARAFITEPVAEGAEIPEPLLNRVEAGIRCFDPCLSCSTHAAGQMPLRIALVDAGGRVLAERVGLGAGGWGCPATICSPVNGLLRVRIRRRPLAGGTSWPLASKRFQGVATGAGCSYAACKGSCGCLCGSAQIDVRRMRGRLRGKPFRCEAFGFQFTGQESISMVSWLRWIHIQWSSKERHGKSI